MAISIALVGQYIAYMFNTRVRLLEKTELMLNIVSNEISFLSRPSNELIYELANRNELSSLKFISVCYDGIEQGMDFKKAWQNSLRKKECVRFYSKGDISLLSSFAEGFGVTDSEGQLSNCSLYKEFLKEKLDEARHNREKYSSMSSGLGILIGVGIIVVFI